MNATRSRQGELRCAELVDIARDLLIEGGLDSFVMRTVAARAGMRLGNLQYYFPTRDDVLEEVIRAEFAKDLAALRAAADAPEEAVDLGRLARVLIGNWRSDSGNVFLALASLAYHNERFRALNREVYEAFHDEIGAVIRRIDPHATSDAVKHRAFLMTSLLDGVALQIHAAPRDNPNEDERIELVTRLLQTIATGERQSTQSSNSPIAADRSRRATTDRGRTRGRNVLG